jgi:hypothetical protein
MEVGSVIERLRRRAIELYRTDDIDISDDANVEWVE